MLTLCVAFLSLSGSPQVTGLDGKPHRPLAEAPNQPKLLLFISHDCPICNAYAPEIQRISKKYKQAGVAVDLVYAEPSLSLKEAKAHVKAYSYTSLHEYLDPTGELSKFAGATITPEAAVYDQQGNLAYRGRIDDLYVAFGKQRTHATTHDLRNALDSVLNHHKVAMARTIPVGCYIATESK